MMKCYSKLTYTMAAYSDLEFGFKIAQRATEYSKGASRGSWDGAEGVWSTFDKRNQIAAE